MIYRNWIYKQANLRCRWPVFLTLATGLFAAIIALLYARQPLLEAHPFRQTETAITAYWMIKEGWQLAYQTPIAGYPWAIPIEFPIFQVLAAVITTLFGFELDAVGRILSFIFLIACGWPAFAIARRLSLPANLPWIFCALLWSSPIYLFWGRTFMIETAALFFSLAAIPYALDLRESSPRARSVLLFTLFATLALLQKITTAIPVLAVFGLVLVYPILSIKESVIGKLRLAAIKGAAFIVPLLVALSWSLYADAVKRANAFGREITMSALFDWYFGTLEQRVSFAKIKLLYWDRIVSNNAAGLLGISILAMGLYYADKSLRRYIALSLVMLVLPGLIFTNQHLHHLYYPAATVVFLLAALVFSLAALQKLDGKNADFATRIFVVAGLTSLIDFEAIAAHLRTLATVIEQSGAFDRYGWPIAALFVLLGAVRRTRKSLAVVLATLVALFAVAVSLLHTYFRSGVMAALFVALSLFMVVMLCKSKKGGMPVREIAALLVSLNLFHFSTGYAHKLWHSQEIGPVMELELGAAIQRQTSEDSAIVIYGYDWSSALAYYSQRKSFTVPDWFTRFDDVWNHPERFIGDKKLGALVFCHPSGKFNQASVLEHPVVKNQPVLIPYGQCQLWLPDAKAN